MGFANKFVEEDRRKDTPVLLKARQDMTLCCGKTKAYDSIILSSQWLVGFSTC